MEKPAWRQGRLIAPSDQSILIVTPDRKTQRTVQRILGVIGYPIDVADTLEQGTRLMQHRAPVIVIVDGSAASSSSADEFFAPALIRRDLFGADKYLLWGTALHVQTITRGSQRAHLVANVADQIRASGQSARVASMAMLLADELISNAVHNAPVDARGEHVRKDAPRDVEIELSGRETVTFRWGCDARYLAIEVSDQFGSLDRRTILAALASSKIRESEGAADDLPGMWSGHGV